MLLSLHASEAPASVSLSFFVWLIFYLFCFMSLYFRLCATVQEKYTFKATTIMARERVTIHSMRMSVFSMVIITLCDIYQVSEPTIVHQSMYSNSCESSLHHVNIELMAFFPQFNCHRSVFVALKTHCRINYNKLTRQKHTTEMRK